MDSKGTQPSTYMYPFRPRHPCHPGATQHCQSRSSSPLIRLRWKCLEGSNHWHQFGRKASWRASEKHTRPSIVMPLLGGCGSTPLSTRKRKSFAERLGNICYQLCFSPWSQALNLTQQKWNSELFHHVCFHLKMRFNITSVVFDAPTGKSGFIWLVFRGFHLSGGS